MMGYQESRREMLFDELVLERVTVRDDGVIELPVYAIREYQEALDLGDEDVSLLEFSVGNNIPGAFIYVIDDWPVDEESIYVGAISFVDFEVGKNSIIKSDAFMRDCLARDASRGMLNICNMMAVDEFGNLYITALKNNCLMVDFIFSVEEDGLGYGFQSLIDNSMIRIWYDGKIMYISPENTHRSWLAS